MVDQEAKHRREIAALTEKLKATEALRVEAEKRAEKAEAFIAQTREGLREIFERFE